MSVSITTKVHWHHTCYEEQSKATTIFNKLFIEDLSEADLLKKDRLEAGFIKAFIVIVKVKDN